MAPRWRTLLCQRSAWSRALRIGLPVGLLQVAVNQGDQWISGTVTAAVIVKSLASPAISTGIALVSAAAVRNTPPRPTS